MGFMNTMKPRRPVGLLLLALLVACDDTSGPAEVKSPWQFSRAKAVNNLGVVVGAAHRSVTAVSTDSVYFEVAGALWTQQRGLVVVEGVDEFVAANDAGHAVGVVHDLAGGATAYIWDGNRLSAIGRFTPTGMDNTGTVAGWALDQTGVRVPVVQRRGARPDTIRNVPAIATFNQASTTALDISGPYVVGAVGDWAESFLWTESSGPRLLFQYDEATAQESIAFAVNAAGWVAGWNAQFSGAFLWKGPRDVTVLEPLADEGGGGRSCAYGLNESGVVVGRSFVARFVQHATKWLPDGTPVDLGPGIAFDVNESGMIVGVNAGWATVWLPDGTRLDLGGPNGTVGTPAATSLRQHVTMQYARAVSSMSWPC